MSIFIILLIMLACGLLGGLINYFLPANDNPDDGNKIKDAWQCLLMGIGATLLVPLFLEIANSRLLDQVYYSFTWQKPVDTVKSQLKTDTIIITRFVDTGTKKTIRTDTLENKKEKGAAVAEAPSTEGQSPAKNYLLYAPTVWLPQHPASALLICSSAMWSRIRLSANNSRRLPILRRRRRKEN